MPRTLSQRALQAFQLTVLTGSVSAAAEAMSRTQPALSRLLKELEQDVGFGLFDRVKGRLVPTSEGRLLFDEIQRSFTGLDRIASIAGEIRQGRRGTLSIASLPAAAAILPPVMRDFAKARPEHAIAFHTVPSESVVRMVLTQGCELGLVSASTAAPGLRASRRYVLPCACIAPPGHRLAAREVVRPADLQGEALVSFDPTTRIGRQFAAVLEQHGVDKVTRVETHLSHLVADLVMEGVGVGVVDCATAMAHAARGGVMRPFEPKVTLEINAVHVAEARLTPSMTLFLDLCDARFLALPGVTLVADRPGAEA
ncbi:LysR family transcriptional regulator [Acetobacteraceae bacterium H6797]|nr:LysR family transcriptional regulator [Acetobacteraceae bacterium H6797]